MDARGGRREDTGGYGSIGSANKARSGPYSSADSGGKAASAGVVGKLTLGSSLPEASVSSGLSGISGLSQDIQAAISGGKPALVQLVKSLQRSDATARTRWVYFCERNGQKRHDPSMHEESFLKRFVTAFEQGTIPDDPSGKIELVQKIKELQRKNA